MDVDFLLPENRCDFEISVKRKNIWKTEIDLLIKLDEVCKRNHLRYFVINGTLLGTVRHGGFIPWDDDLDVMMPRKDYDRLIELAETEFNGSYFLHYPKKGEDYYRNYLRLRSEDTTAIPIKDFDKNTCKGIFIDIFPVDGCDKNRLAQKIRSFRVTVLNEMTNTYIYKSYFQKHKLIRGILYSISKIYVKTMGYEGLLKKSDDLRKKISLDSTDTAQAILHGNKVDIFPKKYIEDVVWKKYEYIEVPVPCGYKEILTMTYGNYMELPPKEKRGLHHKIFFDPFKSYHEYEGVLSLKDMTENLNNY